MVKCTEEDGGRRLYSYESDQFRLVRDKLVNYDNKVKPTYDTDKPITVNFSMDLYQLLELVTFCPTYIFLFDFSDYFQS